MHCPDCGFENLAGAESCDRCGQPLVEQGGPACSLSFRLLETEVGVLVSRPPVFVTADVSIGESLNRLCAESIGCLLVKDGAGKLCGIFSERDAVLKTDPQVDGAWDRPVSELMTADPETIDAAEKVAFAIRAMDLGGYRHLPVTRDGDVIGVVTVRDVLGFLTAAISPGYVA